MCDVSETTAHVSYAYGIVVVALIEFHSIAAAPDTNGKVIRVRIAEDNQFYLRWCSATGLACRHSASK